MVSVLAQVSMKSSSKISTEHQHCLKRIDVKYNSLIMKINETKCLDNFWLKLFNIHFTIKYYYH